MLGSLRALGSYPQHHGDLRASCLSKKHGKRAENWSSMQQALYEPPDMPELVLGTQKTDGTSLCPTLSSRAQGEDPINANGGIVQNL